MRSSRGAGPSQRLDPAAMTAAGERRPQDSARDDRKLNIAAMPAAGERAVQDSARDDPKRSHLTYSMAILTSNC
jgi:hypothetical protein